MPTLSIIVSVHNRKDYLSHAIGTWFSKPAKPEEIIIIDDRSTDDLFGTVNIFCEQHPEWKHIFQYIKVRDEGQGWRNPGVCHNFGVKTCRHPYYVILDPETMFVNDCIANTKFHLEHHPQAFVNAGLHYETNFRYYSDFNPFDIQYVTQKAKTSIGWPSNAEDWTEGWEVCRLDSSYSHAYAAGRKASYIALGGKDESMTGWGWEDVDIRNRMIRNGFTHETTDFIAIVHVGHGLLRKSTAWGFSEDRPERDADMVTNKQILDQNDAMGLKIANEGKEWGVLPIERTYSWG